MPSVKKKFQCMPYSVICSCTFTATTLTYVFCSARLKSEAERNKPAHRILDTLNHEHPDNPQDPNGDTLPEPRTDGFPQALLGSVGIQVRSGRGETEGEDE